LQENNQEKLPEGLNEMPFMARFFQNEVLGKHPQPMDSSVGAVHSDYDTTPEISSGGHYVHRPNINDREYVPGASSGDGAY
jgi:hypothetical protein